MNFERLTHKQSIGLMKPPKEYYVCFTEAENNQQKNT